MKRTLPLLVAIIAGVVMIVAYFIPYTESWQDSVSIWFDVLASIAFILGGGNLLKIQAKKISERGAGWGYAVITAASFLIMLVIGLLKIGVPPHPVYLHMAWSGNYIETGTPFWWLYEYAFKPLQSTIFAMLAFYVASAAFRAFRAKNVEAFLLLGTAFIILLGRTAVGPFLTDWFPDWMSGLRSGPLTDYLMQVFNTAGSRAIMIGIALGTASVSLKILLGVDRSYLGSGDE